MRVMVNCLPAQGPETGGGFTFVNGLLAALARVDRTNEYILVVSESNRARFEFGYDNFQCLIVPGPLRRAGVRVIADNVVLPILARQHRVDLFFSPNDALPYGLRCRSIVGALNVIYYYPLSLSLWQGVSARERFRLRLQRAYYERRTPEALRRADRILAISNETRRQILTNVPGVSPDQVSVIYPGVPGWLRDFRGDGSAKSVSHGNATSGRGRPHSSPFFLSVSAIVPYKNFERLIEAYAEFVGSGAHRHDLIIVGRAPFPAYQRELELMARSLGIRDRVHFRGFVPPDDLAELYRSADGFFLLSTCESFGFPVAEAMACGAPVVVSDRSTLPELVGGVGVVVDPGNIAGICSLMHRLASDVSYRALLSRRSLERSMEFRWETAADQFLALAVDAVGGK